MSYNSYEIRRGVQHTLDNNPHDINMIKHFYRGQNIKNCSVKIPLENIISSKDWSISEKKNLIEFFNYIFEYEKSSQYKLLSPYNIAPIDFAILLENTPGIIGYLTAGGHLSLNSFQNIKHSITSPTQKAKIINTLYEQYSKDKIISVIDYDNQDLKKIPLYDYLGNLLADDFETTRLLTLPKTDIELLYKLLYYSIINNNKSQSVYLKKLIDKFPQEQKHPVTKQLYPALIKDFIKQNNIEQLKTIYNKSTEKILISLDENPCKNNGITAYKTPLTPLQYVLSINDITASSEENIIKRCNIIDYLYQMEPDEFKTSATYSKIIELLIYIGNVKKAKFYYDDALNKNIALDFSFTATEYEENHYKCYIKHSINN